MRAVVQRVRSASVLLAADTTLLGRTDGGMLVYVGVVKGDTREDASWLAEKLSGLRIFEDEEGKMNRSLGKTEESVLLVPQFTLGGDARKGRRPSFNAAEEPEAAQLLLVFLREQLVSLGHVVETGRFGAVMLVRSEVDGPVTILLDSKKLF